ncbi:MAG: cytochrome bc complex cytochrome b subunit [Anaerolineae bacterium]
MDFIGLTFLRNAREKGLRQAIIDKYDETTRAVLAGIGPKELRAILRGDAPTEKPNPRYRAQIKSFWLHVRPKFYQEGSTWFTHTFRLGFLSTFFFIVETITGLILMVYYAPSPNRAYGDMLIIMSNVTYGQFLRDLHRWGAELMVAAVFLHMVRVYFTGSYKHPRQFTWLTGVVLLLVTLFLSFSGYLLPWDQLAYWAVTIGTSMAEAAPLFGNEVNLLLRGSQDIGAGGLLRFYLLHIFFLPLLAIVFLSVHYYKVSREHSISLPASIEEGLAPPEKVKAAKKRIDLIPDLMTSELTWMAVTTAAMVIWVTFFWHAKLEHHSDPLKTPLHTTAPWYFLWLQGMLKVDPAAILEKMLFNTVELSFLLSSKVIMGVILPTMVFLLLFAVPYIDPNPSRLAKNRKVALNIGIIFLITLVLLTYMGTPFYGVAAPPAVEVIQEFIPEEGIGEVRAIPYENLPVGSFDTSELSLANAPAGDLGQVLFHIKERVEAEELLPNGRVVMVIEDWQENLKKITMRVVWQEGDEEQTFDKTVYRHRLSLYEAE